MTNIIQRVAMKALIVDKQGRALILREAATNPGGTQAGRYQMPGGKLEPGEPFDQALYREVLEETGLKIEIDFPIHAGEWRPIIHGVQHQIIGVFFVCKLKGGAKIALSNEHDEFKWIRPEEYLSYNILPPDDQAVARLAEWQNTSPREVAKAGRQ